MLKVNLKVTLSCQLGSDFQQTNTFQTLIKLPSHISESDEVLQFLEATTDDLNPKAAE